MKIVFFGLDKDKQSLFLEELSGAQIVFVDSVLDKDSVQKAEDADAICIFVSSFVGPELIDKMPKLKFIATRSTGFDHVDCVYAKEKGIMVSNVPGYGSHTVAEFTFGLILSLSRRIMHANAYVRESSDFNYFPPMKGFDLYGKTLGVIGTGRIGKNVVKMAKGFSMNVVAYDLYPDQAFAEENGFEYKSLEEALAMSDIITLHAPSTKENYHLLNSDNIPKIKKGACIVNTARGDLIDTEALITGLQSGLIGGAALDVLEGEKELKDEIAIISSPLDATRAKDYKMLLENHVLMEMPNVIITPHIAFYTDEAVSEILKITRLNLEAFMSGSPINLVNR